MVKQGSDHTLRFDKLGYTPSTVSAVGRTRLIAAKQAVVDSAEALRLRAVPGGPAVALVVTGRPALESTEVRREDARGFTPFG